MKGIFYKILMSFLCLFCNVSLYGQTQFADVLIDAFYNGASQLLPSFYGNTFAATDCSIIPINPSICLGDNDGFVSLPTGSYVTVGFTDNLIVDAPNQDDLFIEELGAATEIANVYISSDFGMNFTFLGQIDGGVTNVMDLADINYTQAVNAVKIEGIDRGGCAPGFDVVRIYGIEGANCSASSLLEEPEPLCPNTGIYNLQPLVLGDSTGYWVGNNVIDGQFNTAMASGIVDIIYVVEDEIPYCPNDTAFINLNFDLCDCNGIINGGAALDECGQCLQRDDPNFNACLDCADVPFGNSEIDTCGNCLPLNSMEFNSCLDCAGVFRGNSILDACGNCLLPSSSEFNACLDCAGVPFGNSMIDACGSCLLPNSSEFNACLDCAGVPFGNSVIDTCGNCLLPNSTEFNACIDCQGTLFGDFVLDECGKCLMPGDSTFNSCLDCAGVPFGNAQINKCGLCSELNSINTCLEDQLIYIPNAFSPNRDGINDSFQIFPGKGKVSRIEEYAIYNRWGGLVFRRQNFGISENGNWWGALRTGPEIPGGNYMYFINVTFINGESKTYSGLVSVVL
ncbi:MAG: gliding motility-associated C-terminal domain-containing protein [Bacteroidota bacterium]